MSGTSHQEEPEVWARQQFGAATLSDVRRVRRAVRIAEAMATKPGGSLPQLFTTPYEVKAAYTFFRHAEASPDRLQAGHREGVQQALQQRGEYLLLESVLKMRLIRQRDDYPYPSVPDGPDDKGMATYSRLLSGRTIAGPPPQMGAVADCERSTLR